MYDVTRVLLRSRRYLHVAIAAKHNVIASRIHGARARPVPSRKSVLTAKVKSLCQNVVSKSITYTRMTVANRNVKYKSGFTAHMAVAIGFSDTVHYDIDESLFTVRIQTSTRLQHSSFAYSPFELVSP